MYSELSRNGIMEDCVDLFRFVFLMRIWFYILLGLNLVLLAVLLGWLPSPVEDATEPERKRAQIAQSTAKPVSLDQVTAAGSTLPLLPPPPSICFDVGPLTAAESDVLRANLVAADPSLKLELLQLDDGATYMVAIAPSASLREAQRREAEARNLGVRDTYIVQDGQSRLAVSVGIFRSEELAQNLVKSLADRGLGGLQIVTRPNPNPNTNRMSVRVLDVPKEKLEATRKLLDQLPVRACAQK